MVQERLKHQKEPDYIWKSDSDYNDLTEHNDFKLAAELALSILNNKMPALNQEAENANKGMAIHGYVEPYVYRLKTAQKDIENLSEAIRNKENDIEEINGRLFNAARTLLSHYQFIQQDFTMEYISENDYFKYMTRLVDGIPICKKLSVIEKRL